MSTSNLRPPPGAAGTPEGGFSPLSPISPISPRIGHFRSYERRTVRLAIEIFSPRSEGSQPAVIVNLSLAGAALEARGLVRGDRLTLAISTPTTWDPLIVESVVAWTGVSVRTSPGLPVTRVARGHEASESDDNPLASVDSVEGVVLGGVGFDYASASTVLAMFEMLATIGYE